MLVVSGRRASNVEAVREVRPKVVAQRVERDAVLRTARAGHRGHDGREVELEELVEFRVGAGHPPQALHLRVLLDERHASVGPSGEAEVGQCLVVDREEGGGRPEFGAHVADRRPVGQGDPGQTVAGELDECPDDAVRAEHLGHDEDQVGCGRAPRQLAVEPHADNSWHRLVKRLAKQDGLRLDAADAVAEHAEAVDHRGMRVRAHECVRERGALAIVDDRGEKFEIHLVDDAGPGRHDAQVPERGLRPAQQLVALAVPLVLALDVEGECPVVAEHVDLDGVVDDKVGRDERVDQRRVAAEIGHRVAHDREVDDRWDACEVLEDHPRRHERDLGLGSRARPPGCQRLDILAADDPAAGMAEQVLEEDLQRDWRTYHVQLVVDGVEAEVRRSGRHRPAAWRERQKDRSWVAGMPSSTPPS